MFIVTMLFVGAVFGFLVICGSWFAIDLIIGTSTLTGDIATGIVLLSAIITLVLASGLIIIDDMTSR